MKHIASFIALLYYSVAALAQDVPGSTAFAPVGGASIAQYAVNQSTGTFTTSLPLLELKGSFLTHPINLGYAASGVKVNQLSSWVGLGWELAAGGMITRQVNDWPDDLHSMAYPVNPRIGYLYWNDTLNTIAGKTLPQLTATEKDQVFKETHDKEPDLFYFNFNGYSGTFRFDIDGTPRIETKQDLKITYTINPSLNLRYQELFPPVSDAIGAITGFTITTPDGVKYIFDQYEYVITSSDGQTESLYNGYVPTTDCSPSFKVPYKHDGYLNSIPIIKSWKLSSIVDQYGRTEFLFEYTKEIYTDHSSIAQWNRWQTPALNQNFNHSSEVVLNYDKRLNKIKYGSHNGTSFLYYGEARFITETTDRPDIYYSTEFLNFLTFSGFGGNNHSRLLKKIELVSGSDVVKTLEFTYGTFAETTLSGCPAYVEAHRKRPKLLSVQEKNLTASLPAYSFAYNTTALPPRHSASIDWWGFYNGSSANTFLPYLYAYPNHSYYTGTYRTIYSLFALNNLGGSAQVIVNPGGIGVNRAVNTTYSQAGVLTGITYPSGGQMTMTYENNTILLNIGSTSPTTQTVTAGGLRIKSIATDDKNGHTNTVNYYYDSNTDGTGTTTGRFIELPVFAILRREQDVNMPSGQSLDNRIIYATHATSSNRRGSNATGNPIVIYNKVTESLTTGKTVTTFVTSNYAGTGTMPASSWFAGGPAFTENYPNGSLTNDNYKSGTVSTQQIYNASGSLVREITYGYTQTSAAQNTIRAIKTHYTSAAPVDDKMNWCIYTHVSVDYKLTSVTTKDYDGSQFMTTTKNLSYAALNGTTNQRPHHMVLSQSLTNSDNKVYRTDYKYGYEMGDLSIHDFLFWRNIPLEILSFVDNVQVGGRKRTFKSFNGDLNFSGQDDDASFSGGSDPDKSSAGLAGPPETLTALWQVFNWESTAGWVKQVEFLNYYVTGHTKVIQPVGHAKIRTTFNFAKGLLDTEEINPDGPVIWTTYYFYNTDLSLESMLDKNDQVVSYGYDDLNRINQITTKNGNVTANYTYNIALANGGGNTNYVQANYTITGIANVPSTKSFYDGFGRNFQTDRLSYTPNNTNYTISETYDNLGRVTQRCNPSAGGCTTYTYENSPLNRVLSSKAPGWTPTVGQQYKLNTSTDVSGYAVNTLYKLEITDENGIKSYEFRDKIGQLILARRVFSATQNADTRYYYDGAGNLTHVLPPGVTLQTDAAAFRYEYYQNNRLWKKYVPGKGTYEYSYYGSAENNYGMLKEEKHAASGIAMKYTYNIFDQVEKVEDTSVPATPKTLKTFVYETAAGTALGKMKEKNVYILGGANGNTPGATALKTTYTYDAIYGRLETETADNNFGKTDQYTYTYDFRDNITRIQRVHQATIGGVTSTVTVVKDYTYDKAGRKTTLSMSKDGGASQQLNSLSYNNNDWLITRKLGLSGVNILQQVDYQYNSRGWLTNINSVPVGTNPCAGPSSIVGGNTEIDWFHDGLIQTVVENDEAGNPYLTLRVDQSKESDEEHLALLEKELSIPLAKKKSGTLTSTARQFDLSGAAGEKQVKSQAWGAVASAMEEAGYTTEDSLALRSLKSDLFAQWDAASAPEAPNSLLATSADLFALRLTYTGVGAGSTQQYNGNITEQRWYVNLTGRNQQLYTFAYDNLNRMTLAKYAEVSPFGDESTCKFGIDNYNEAITYSTADLRGNISNIQRRGVTGGTYPNYTYGLIDNIDMTYNTDNRLNTVKENSLSTKGFNGTTALLATATHDSRGNLTADPSRGITAVSYNYFNLPFKIQTSTGVIDIIYDTDGKILRKTVTPNGGAASVTDYVSGFVYATESGVKRLRSIYHDEGRMMDISTTSTPNWKHEYVLKDHLGNGRVFFCDKSGNGLLETSAAAGEVTQEAHYYPFGLMMEGGWYANQFPTSPYLYNGIERTPDLGLNVYTAMYRTLDPGLARWWQVDPRGENLYAMTPYNAMGNSPAVYNDPNGDIIPVLVYVGAAVIGGGLNLWSNWDKVKDFSTGAAYFLNGAAGGLVSTVNPVLGGSITAFGNGVTDIVTGNVPDFKNDWDVLKYEGKLFLDGLGASGAGGISRSIYGSVAGWWQRLDWGARTISYGKASTLIKDADELAQLADEGITHVAQLEEAAVVAGKINRISPQALEVTHSLTMSKTKFGKLVKDISENGIQESIKYVEHNGVKYVVDGHHRLQAAKSLGLSEVPVEQVKLPYLGYKTVEDLIFSW